MRMWMVDPKLMCRQHLLGEHVECHMLAGTMLKGKSIQGFLDKKLVEPRKLVSRHDELVEEMKRRGYNHKTPLHLNTAFFAYPDVGVSTKDSLKELRKRCKNCKAYIYK